MIIDELKFSIPANICLAFGFFTLSRDNKQIMQLNIKNFAKVYLGLTAITTGLIIGYNLLFEPYWYICIN